MNKGWKYGIGLGMVIVLLFMANLLIGSVSIPVSDVFSILIGHEGEKASWSFIVWESHAVAGIQRKNNGFLNGAAILLRRSGGTHSLCGR